ncbi:hypothetical protein MNBD_GAMMA20-2275 [hydrothermal vent metagenome]|uniref:Uncharacterized protein n=1 Tax=hydrothermal vent metagenome TaxID=652676 RepID=A0A3B1API0_9ZZZZ
MPAMDHGTKGQTPKHSDAGMAKKQQGNLLCLYAFALVTEHHFIAGMARSSASTER